MPLHEAIILRITHDNLTLTLEQIVARARSKGYSDNDIYPAIAKLSKSPQIKVVAKNNTNYYSVAPPTTPKLVLPDDDTIRALRKRDEADKEYKEWCRRLRTQDPVAYDIQDKALGDNWQFTVIKKGNKTTYLTQGYKYEKAYTGRHPYKK
jgi:hypothetical protein